MITIDLGSVRERCRLVTVGQTWVDLYNSKATQQSMEWKHSDAARLKKFRAQEIAGKVLTSTFWNSQGIIMLNVLNKGKAITRNYYSTLLPTLQEASVETRRGVIHKGIMFLQNNSSAHESHVV